MVRPDRSEDIERLIHELEVHQIELELQNEELQRAQAIIEDSRSRYAELYDFAPIGYFIFDKKGLIKDVNLTGAALLGVERRNLVGNPFNPFILPEDRNAFLGHRNEVCSTDTKHTCEITLARKNGTTFYASMESIALKDTEGNSAQCLSSVTDITERKRAEENVLRLNRLYSMLTKVNEEIVRIREPEELYERVCRIAVEDGQFKMAWIGLKDPDSLSVRPVAGYGDTGGYLKGIEIYAADIPEGRGPTGKAVFEDTYSICSDIEHDPRMLPWREKALRHGFRSSAAFPLHAGPEVIGAFTIYSSKPQFFTDEETGLLSSLAEDISFAISSVENEKQKLAAEEALRKHREELEALVEKRTEELKKLSDELGRSNADLKQFAYAASHDLKEPLRNIGAFAGLLEKRYKGNLDEKADEFIDYIVEGVKRMERLIQDLLEYSQVDRKGKPFGPVNCSVALEEAIHNLRSAIEESGTELTYDLLPTVTGDASQLSRLFQNLVSNAIKFRADKPLKIHISADRKQDEWSFSVKDNGIGIDPKFAERIFVIFQRLHTREEYEGTGIGLSICKKIVERHGGRIWVKSEPGRGSTFYFTIPDRPVAV
jgi:PAS domain S-box-containing protein